MKKSCFEENSTTLCFIILLKAFILWTWILNFISCTFQSGSCCSFTSFYALTFTSKATFSSSKSLPYLSVNFVTGKAYWILPAFPSLFFSSLFFAFIAVYNFKIILFIFTFVTRVLFSVFIPNYTSQCIFFSINWTFLNWSSSF